RPGQPGTTETQDIHGLPRADRSDEQIARDEDHQAVQAVSGSARPRLALLFKSITVLLIIAQTASLVVVAAISLRTSRQLSTLERPATQPLMPPEMLVLTPQVKLATVADKVLYREQISGKDEEHLVVLVRPLYGEEEPWYVQNAIESGRDTNTFEAVVC